ncbi:hypothetical protein [Streptomyces sp. NBC_00878]|uniref:hypothetical protein n=1 Tax=Streptomyces sp. NBC_00878 TaxID=2975854 RepID=UPI00225910D7|nr:hypothetical protein [Streptomyces sp. NBC_00878]MCX4904763.1 hypothetical protein [Streptomyces sp. NBC_00878]
MDASERARIEQSLRAVAGAGKAPDTPSPEVTPSAPEFTGTARPSVKGGPPRRRTRALLVAVAGTVILAAIPLLFVNWGHGSSAAPAVDNQNTDLPDYLLPGQPSASPSTLVSGGAKDPSAPVSPGGSATGEPHDGHGLTRKPSAPGRTVEPSTTSGTTPTPTHRPAPLAVPSTRAMNPGDSIVNGPTTLTFSSGGNLVVTYNGAVTWSSGTTSVGARAVFQSDGNFVVYKQDSSTAWSTRTDGHDGAVLMIGSNGNLYIEYRNTVLWQGGPGS